MILVRISTKYSISHDLTDHHKRMRMERNRQILDEIDRGTLPNFVFTDEKKNDMQSRFVNEQNDRVWGSPSLVEDIGS